MRIAWVLAVVVAGVCVAGGAGWGQTGAGGAGVAVKPGVKRAVKAIDADIEAAQKELKPQFQPYKLLGKAQRKQMLAGAGPVLRKLVGLLDERVAASTGAADKAAAADKQCVYLGILSTVGDKDATDRLTTMSASTVKADAARGKIGLAFAGWWLNYGSVDKQVAALDAIGSAGTDADGAAAEAALLILEGQNMTHETQVKVRQMGVAHFKTAAYADTKAAWQKALSMMALEDKPMKITGRTLEGKDFDSTAWKGKVVLVDFWASWCEPCKEVMPKTIAMYEKYHGEGLEIVGVTSEYVNGDLAAYLKGNAGMKWPELYARGGTMADYWHPMAKLYGVVQIPTVFVIDKEGICRTVSGLEEAEKLVPKLLAEGEGK